MQLNQKCSIELLYDNPTTGRSQYGDYYLYTVRNGDGATEYSFFAPPEVHEQLKHLKKGDRATVCKLAEQRGSKIITRFDVVIEKPNPTQNSEVRVDTTTCDNFYEIMLSSCKDAVRIQQELGGLMDAKSIAVTLFIARSRVSVNGMGG